MTHPRGERIAKYVIRQKLAEGGMAEIFLCTLAGPEGFAKDVVVKRIRPTFAADPLFLQRFVAEARLASLLNHPNVVQIFDFGKADDGSFYLAMEYVRGCSLWELKRRCAALGEGRLPPMLVAKIGMEVARGLHCAHRLNEHGRPLELVHRDVSPHNVLLSEDGAVKLADFGVARAASNAMTASGMLVGKFAYMSPEQGRGDPIDARTDVFALGIVLWELVMGSRLFEADSDVGILRAVQERLIAPPARFDDRIPPELDAAIMKALERDVERRFQSAQELERALAECLFKNVKSVDETDLVAFLRRVMNEDDTTVGASQRPAAVVGEGEELVSGEASTLEREPPVSPAFEQSLQLSVQELSVEQEDAPAKRREPTLVQRPDAARKPAAVEEAPPRDASPADSRGALGAELPPFAASADEDGEQETAVLSRRAAHRAELPVVAERAPGAVLEGAVAARPKRDVGRFAFAGGLIALALLVAASRFVAAPLAPSSPLSSEAVAGVGEESAAAEAKQALGLAGRGEGATPAAAQGAGEKAASVGGDGSGQKTSSAGGAGMSGAAPSGAAAADAERPAALPANAAAAGVTVPVTGTPLGGGSAEALSTAEAAAPAPEVLRGELRLRVTPWAMVFLNGRSVGEVTGTRILRLPPGRHRLRFEHPRTRREETLEVRSGKRTSFEFNALKPD